MWTSFVLTLFPEMFPGPLGCALSGKGLKKQLWDLKAINIRHFATDKHRTVDEPCYGPNPGMIMKPDVVDKALTYAYQTFPIQSTTAKPALVYVSPRGTPLNQKHIHKFVHSQGMIVLCGRYEGIDDRVIEYWRQNYQLQELSIGDYVLSGGELATMVLLDACVRLLPGIVHNQQSLVSESFELDLLEFPQYTKPCNWKGKVVPDLLLSGNHEKIAAWQKSEAERITRQRRPDLWERYVKEVKGEKDEHY